MRVLIVEDEPAITDFVSRGLHGDGARGQRRPRRRRGGAACPAGGIDLVILDLMLPRRDGLDVLGIIRRERPTLPVIVLSARDGVPDRVAGLDAGATDYMVKPFSFAELAARVRAHLRGPEQPRGSRLSGSGIELDLLSREVNRDGRPSVSLRHRGGEAGGAPRDGNRAGGERLRSGLAVVRTVGPSADRPDHRPAGGHQRAGGPRAARR